MGDSEVNTYEVKVFCDNCRTFMNKTIVKGIRVPDNDNPLLCPICGVNEIRMFGSK